MTDKKKNLALTGGAAAAEALKQINPDVMPVYPITPQTPIIETYAKMVADGEADTEMIEVESEHSAMSATVGASAAGARAMTASSSQGIMLMAEILPIASGMRLPILMLVSARAISAPINIHGDHQDVMFVRDAGWIQIFSENAQEVYDNTLIALQTGRKSAACRRWSSWTVFKLRTAWKIWKFWKIQSRKILSANIIRKIIYWILKIRKLSGRFRFPIHILNSKERRLKRWIV